VPQVGTRGIQKNIRKVGRKLIGDSSSEEELIIGKVRRKAKHSSGSEEYDWNRNQIKCKTFKYSELDK
jgi:hypothetical protein